MLQKLVLPRAHTSFSERQEEATERQLEEMWMGCENGGLRPNLIQNKRQAVLKTSFQTSSEPLGENGAVEYLQRVFNKRQKQELFWGQWPGGLYEISPWSLITKTQRNVRTSFGAAAGNP